MTAISSLGVGSGLDINTLVSDLVTAEREPAEARLDLRQAEYEAELSAYGLLKSSLAQFQDSMGGLTDLSTLQARTATSSDSAVFTATAGAAAANGSYGIEVEQLAESHKVMSGGFATNDTLVGTGSLAIATGADSFTVTIDSSNNTLEGIRDAINGDANNTGVTASILRVDDGVGGTVSKLVLTANETGTANAVSVSVTDGDGNDTDASGLSQLASANLTDINAAQDARIYVDGQLATRSTNTIDDVIEGVTLDLAGAAPGTTETLTIADDTGSIGDAINGFVASYNELIAGIKEMSSYDSQSGEAGILLGDSTLRGIQTQLRQGLSNPVQGRDGNWITLADIGITTNRDGTLSVDQDALNSAITTDFNAVADLFAATDGVAVRLDSSLDSYLDEGGILESRTDGLESSLADIQKQNEDLDRRMENLEARYLAQFIAMDQTVAKYNSTGDYLTDALANLPGAYDPSK